MTRSNPNPALGSHHDGSPMPSRAGDGAGVVAATSPATPAPSTFGSSAGTPSSFHSTVMLDIAAARADQARHGHTLEADRAKPLDDMAREISRRATGVREDTQFNVDRAILRRHAVALAALLAALVDRIDADVEANPFEDFPEL